VRNLLHTLTVLFALAALSCSCGVDHENGVVVNARKECNLSMNTNEVQSGEDLDFTFDYIGDAGKKAIDTLIFIDDELVPQGRIYTADLPMGKHVLRGRMTFEDFTNCESYRSFEIGSDIEPELWSTVVLDSYPHEKTAFTQGLTWHEGRLYEGTGVYGETWIYNYAPKKRDYKDRVEMPLNFFGEGISILNGKLYQLTYKENTGFIYDLKTMKKLREFSYSGEGWGLTDDGTYLIMSDGTHTLRFIDSESLQVVRELPVYSNKGKEVAINEMEYVDGVIYANIYNTPYLVRINPDSGKVLGYIDCRGLLPADQRTGNEDVLNGIAYDPIRQVFFLTGKYWPKMFEVRFNTLPQV
jgi:glutaminyl-peptide cyclotransferase